VPELWGVRLIESAEELEASAEELEAEESRLLDL